MTETVSVFRSWVPEWLIRFTLFIVLVPCMLLFGLSTANGPAAAGHYGIEPADVQFSMVLFYAALAGFSALERRFFTFIASKEYFVIGTVLQLVACYVCYSTRNLHVLFTFRFLQGMINCATNSICITLVFSRLRNERAREIGYSLFYCVLLCISPLTTLITAGIVDNYDYNVLYKWIIYMYLPGAILLFVIMNNVRLNRKFPLYQMDWASFVIYALALCVLGYVLIYGQQYYWVQDKRIRGGIIALILLLAIHVLRQLKLKRPYLSLEVFKYRNFKVGIVLILILYVCRGALGICTTYFASVLGMDPIHISYLMLANMAGVVLSALISSRLIILKRPTRLILIYGFAFLLVFHVWMCFLFVSQADAEVFVIPLFVQGFGAGMLMTPIIVFMTSSVPPALSNSASNTGVFFRFCGFCGSLALINYFQLAQKNAHYLRFQEQLSELNPLIAERLLKTKQALMGKGVAADMANKMARASLARSVDVQAQLRYAMDYYQLISWLLLGTLLLVALIPYINKTIINLKSSQPAPVSY